MKTGIVLLLSIVAGLAQTAPTGNLSYEFTEYAIWDLTGLYVTNDSSGVVTADITHSPKGKISGTRSEVYDEPPDHYEGHGSLQGVVSSNSGGVVGRFSSKTTYSGNVSGVSFVATASSSEK